MAHPFVVLILGSGSDWSAVKPATAVLDQLGVPFELHVSSAHRTPERTIEIVTQADEAGAVAFICCAGMAAHLAGVVASKTQKPVLGVPLGSGVLDGVDALLSTVQMPPGVPVATFAVGSAGARNAAFFAARILALDDEKVRAALELHLQRAADKVLASSEQIRAELENN